MQASGVPLCPHARDYLSRVNLWTVRPTSIPAAALFRHPPRRLPPELSACRFTEYSSGAPHFWSFPLPESVVRPTSDSRRGSLPPEAMPDNLCGARSVTRTEGRYNLCVTKTYLFRIDGAVENGEFLDGARSNGHVVYSGLGLTLQRNWIPDFVEITRTESPPSTAVTLIELEASRASQRVVPPVWFRLCRVRLILAPEGVFSPRN